MKRIENNSLFLCSLKELLHNFHLPMLPVLTEDTDLERYKGRVYIKDGWVVRNEGDRIVKLYEYTYNKKSLNLTKNMIINSSTYDEYTHRYLGDYLRFQRDYNHYDLMGMYNCFYGITPRRIYKVFKWPYIDDYGTERIKTLTIDTDNDKYFYYIVPVKFDQVYTVSIESQISYEVMCILYNDMFIDDSPVELTSATYKKVPGSSFKRPFLFSTKDLDITSKVWNKEHDLCMLIKIPRSIKSSIVVLEGNFLQYGESIGNKFIPTPIYNEDKCPTRYICRSSLLDVNNGETYYLAERMVEFILGNIIGPFDWIDQNIERVREDLYTYDSGYGLWTDKLRSKIYKLTYTKDTVKNNGNRFIDNNFDVTGYVDKDVERFIGR